MLAKACLFIDLQHTEVNENTDRPSLPEQNLVPSYQRLCPEVCCQGHQHNQTQASVANTVTDLSEQEGMCGTRPPEALFRNNGQLRQPTCLEPPHLPLI